MHIFTFSNYYTFTSMIQNHKGSLYLYLIILLLKHNMLNQEVIVHNKTASKNFNERNTEASAYIKGCMLLKCTAV